MGSSTEESVLDALEQAEMAARERHLAASSEAEQIVAAAQQQAAEISAAAAQRVDEALDALRQAVEADADAAIEVLEREAAQRDPGSTVQDQAGLVVEQAVAFVVARVLGESVAPPTPEERV